MIYAMDFEFASTKILAIGIAFAIIVVNSNAIPVAGTAALRGGRGSTHHDHNNLQHQHRELILENDTECTLYLKIKLVDETTRIEENGSADTDEAEWSCEFPRNYLHGIDIMDIEGIDKKFIDEHGAISGESILRTRNALVRQSISIADLERPTEAEAPSPMIGDDNVFNRADTNNVDTDAVNFMNMKLVVTDPSHSVIEKIDENDARHHRHRRRRRRLAQSKGVAKTLVVRAVSPNGSAADASAAQLRNDIFEGDICLKSQMEALSYNQLEIQPASVGGGVVEVNIDFNPITNDGTFRANRDELSKSAVSRTDELYGGSDGLAVEYDLVLFCLPASGSWHAYAYENRYDTYYNNDRCSEITVLMHEVGHSLGLSHSGTIDGDGYSDKTGYMGYGSSAKSKSYNAVKNYQLGWYEPQIDSYDPIEEYTVNNNPQKSFVLNGVVDYDSSGDELITLRLKQFGHNGGIDYYLGYNRKSGPNIGCEQGCDKVILYSKDKGERGYASTRIAILDVGQSYQIENYKLMDSTVTITFDSITNNMKDATVTVSATPPTLPCDGLGGFHVEIGIDSFEGETWWKLYEQPKDAATTTTTTEEGLVLIEEGMDKSEYKRKQQYVEPSPDEGRIAYCLNRGACYQFRIYDEHGDGLKSDQDGYWRIFLDDELLFQGADFKKQETRTFCVGDNIPPTTKPITIATTPSPTTKIPTTSPTALPTTAPPTISPPTTTSSLLSSEAGCFDDDTLKYKSVKNCNWVRKDTSKRCELPWLGKQLKQYCPITCGLCTAKPPPTPSPTTKLPTVAPTEAPQKIIIFDDATVECEDDSTFRYGENQRQCDSVWLRNKLQNRCELNAKVGQFNADGTVKKIRDMCPMTCGACKQQQQPLTSSNKEEEESVVVEKIVVAEEQDENCQDDNNLRFNNGKSCKWLQKTKKNQAKKWCNKQKGYSACPSTCGKRLGIGKCR